MSVGDAKVMSVVQEVKLGGGSLLLLKYREMITHSNTVIVDVRRSKCGEWNAHYWCKSLLLEVASES
jgi:hypothetical protein